MKIFDITVLTDDYHLNNPQSNGAIEDAILISALKSKRLEVNLVSWTDPTFDWATTKAAIFNTTWDYFYHAREWESFLEKISNATRLLRTGLRGDNRRRTPRFGLLNHVPASLHSLNVPTTNSLTSGKVRIKLLMANHRRVETATGQVVIFSTELYSSIIDVSRSVKLRRS